MFLRLLPEAATIFSKTKTLDTKVFCNFKHNQFFRVIFTIKSGD